MTDDRWLTLSRRGSTAKSVVRHPIVCRLVIATHNPGKLAEMRELLAPYGIDAISAGELGLAEPEETGMTFRDNARIKARSGREGDRAAGLRRRFRPCGRRARRRAGNPFRALGRAGQEFPPRHGDDRRKTARARRHHAGAPHARISSRRCASPGRTGMSRNSKRALTARWSWPPRGEQGFGYDPMFLPDGHARTFGEMSSEEKHGLPPRGKGLSHRARAFLKLAEACLEKR